MVLPLLKTLAAEKVFLVNPTSGKLPFPIEGVIRLVDTNGNTLGLVVDKKTLDTLDEEMDAQNPDFLTSLEKSRRSGRVSAKEVKHKAGLS
jgi:hypothetical protein